MDGEKTADLAFYAGAADAIIWLDALDPKAFTMRSRVGNTWLSQTTIDAQGALDTAAAYGLTALIPAIKIARDGTKAAWDKTGKVVPAPVVAVKG